MRKSTLNIKYLSQEELKRLFACISSVRDRAIFRLAYHRGLRASEVALLQMADYQPAAGRLFVHRLKNGNDSEYGLSNVELQSLKAWLKIRGKEPGPIFTSNRGTGISQQMLDVLMRRYCRLANIPADRCHFHVLRHSCATQLIERGEDIAVIKSHLGHKNLASTDEYAKITNKARKAADSRLKNWV